MQTSRIKKIINDLFDFIPGLKDIFHSPDDLNTKRKNALTFLALLQEESFSKGHDIAALEWVVVHDAIGIFSNIISTRSETLTGFEFFKYLNNLVAGRDLGGLEEPLEEPLDEPSDGFLAEIEHLFKAIAGKSGIYSSEVTAFEELEGQEAAKYRSGELSREAAQAQEIMKQYPSGLDTRIADIQQQNKLKILETFNASEKDWQDWNWHTANIIKDADTLKSFINLKQEEYDAVRFARDNHIPFGITPYYLALMDFAGQALDDRVLRAQVIPSPEYIKQMQKRDFQCDGPMDFMLEKDTSPVDGITRRYPMILILKPIMTCPQICVYCQRNWEIEDPDSKSAALSREKLEKAMAWIKETPEIREVLITGGDPFLLSDSTIIEMLDQLSKIEHVERIRFGTRTPVTLPLRITDELVDGISKYHQPGRREVLIITHFESALEITADAVEAVQKFRRSGISVYNQLVFTFFNSRRFEAANLRNRLRLAGVTPYYTFNTKGKDETADFRVPIPRLLQEQKEEARLMPGSVRTDEIVFNLPRLGKNYLRAVQNHDLVGILPDGRRVYEFHPWEKNISLVDTFVYTDVSIYDYLERLKASGENPEDYQTIWYYY